MKGREGSVGAPWSSLRTGVIIVSIDARRACGGRRARALTQVGTRTALMDGVDVAVDVVMLSSDLDDGRA